MIDVITPEVVEVVDLLLMPSSWKLLNRSLLKAGSARGGLGLYNKILQNTYEIYTTYVLIQIYAKWLPEKPKRSKRPFWGHEATPKRYYAKFGFS